jgi:hypothetical protein
LQFIRAILLVTILIASKFSFSQDEKFKAVYLYNFTKYIEWSAPSKQGDFVIGVLGNSDIFEPLKVVAEKMKVGNQPIVVKRFNSPDEIGRCQLLFVPENKINQLSIILAKSISNILIVSDKKGMISQGSGICFYMDNTELKFEVSKPNIEKQGLKVNPALLVLGKSQ